MFKRIKAKKALKWVVLFTAAAVVLLYGFYFVYLTFFWRPDFSPVWEIILNKLLDLVAELEKG